MARPLIVLGDKTSHGGTVISADSTFYIHAKRVARIGDMTECPKCKGRFPITSGAENFFDRAGNSYARHMDETACGATLISSQVSAFWDNHSVPGAGSAVDSAKFAAPTSSGVCLDCLLKAAAAGSSTLVRE